MALDRAYANTIEQAIRERLESTLSLILASIDENETGERLLIDDITDGRLTQPDSGLTAGFKSQDSEWYSASLLGEQPLALPETPVGEQVFQLREHFYADKQQQYVLSWQLVWETSTQTTLPISLWAAADYAEYQRPVSVFRSGLWRWLSAAGFLLLALQTLVGWQTIKPLRRVAREVQAIEHGDSTRLDGPYPTELQPLTDNLNALLASERSGQQRYRKALGNLAHGMKTPLAVLKTAVAQEQLSAVDRQQANSAVNELHDVMRYQLERAASAARKTIHEPLAVAAVVKRIVNTLKKVYQAQEITFHQKIDNNSMFYGEERDLMELLGNLLENACKYGSGVVKISAQPTQLNKRRPGLKLTIADNGAGLVAAEFQKLLQRGLRGDEKVDGHGLGLSIVSEIADAYEAKLYSAVSDLGGLAVIIEFPGQ